MRFGLLYTEEASAQRDALEKHTSRLKQWKAVRRALALMETNLRHPSLQTHKYESLQGPHGEDVFEAYAENLTAGATRIFRHYGPGKRQITILAIVPHP